MPSAATGRNQRSDARVRPLIGVEPDADPDTDTDPDPDPDPDAEEKGVQWESLRQIADGA